MATKKSAKEKPAAKKSVVKQAKETVAKFVEAITPQAVSHDTHPELNSLSLREIMAQAWSEVIGSGDPVLAEVAPDYVGILHAHASSALKDNGALLKGDTQLARFESACARLRPYFKGDN